MHKHLVRLALAIVVIAVLWAVAIVKDMARLKTPGIDPAELMMAGIAIALSLPPLAGLTFFASRKSLREAWQHADASTRGIVVLYLTADAVGAAISWVVFARLVVRQ